MVPAAAAVASPRFRERAVPGAPIARVFSTGWVQAVPCGARARVEEEK